MISRFFKLKMTALISLGAALEFYDFAIYGLFSSYMGNSFFPRSVNNNSSNIIEILLIFGTGYLARPVGGLLFGNIGDKYGRKFSFSITLIIMAVATCFVGVIPPYAKIGIFAPILLLLFRIIQGVSMGAELPISSVLVFEHVSFGKNIFYGATLFGLSNIGLLLGNCLNFGLANWLSLNDINEFGWRIPFIVGGILGVIAVYLRKQLHETSIFRQMRRVQTPWKVMFISYRDNFVASVLISLSYGLCVNFGFVLLFSVLEQLYHVPQKILAILTLISTIIFCIIDSVIGFIADYYKIRLLSLATIGALQFSLSFYLVLNGYATHSYIIGFISMVWLTIATSCFDSTIPNLLPRIFPAEVRSTGVATSYSIGLGLSGVIASISSMFVITKLVAVWLLPILILVIHIISVRYLYKFKLAQNNCDLLI